MKITIERDPFAEALRAVSGRCARTDATPILTHLLLTAENNRLRVTAHDLSACSIITIPAEIEEAGSAAIESDRLVELIGGCSAGSQVFVQTEGSRATVRCGRARYVFGTLPHDDFPAVFEPKNPTTITLTEEQVKQAFDIPFPCIGKEKSRVYFNGICLRNENNALVAVAANGHMLLRNVVKENVAAFEPVIVPETSCGEFVKVAALGESKIEISDNLISIEAGNRRFVSKLIDGEFPAYDHLIPKPSAAPLLIDVADLDAALSRLMAARDAKQIAAVALSWSEGDQNLKAELRSQFGDGVEEIQCDIGECPQRKIGIQVEYLRTLADAAGGEYIRLHVGDIGLPVRIDNPNNKNLVALCMLCAVP